MPVLLCSNRECPERSDCYTYRAFPGNWQGYISPPAQGCRFKRDLPKGSSLFRPTEQVDSFLEERDRKSSAQ